MTPDRLLKTAILPALAELAAAGIRDSLEARRHVLAISLQESGLAHRRQVTNSGAEDGPAASWWQFERGGGCRGVLTHPAVAPRMRGKCVARETLTLLTASTTPDVFRKLAWDNGRRLLKL